MEMWLDDEVEEARKALAELMSRALKESCRRQKADEEVAAYLQKVSSYPEIGPEPIKNFSARHGGKENIQTIAIVLFFFSDSELNFKLLQAKVYEELYLEEVRKREELEAALARADREIAQLRRAFGRPNTPTEGPQHATPTRSATKSDSRGAAGWQPAEPFPW
jgi:hypothetical protein